MLVHQWNIRYRDVIKLAWVSIINDPLSHIHIHIRQLLREGALPADLEHCLIANACWLDILLPHTHAAQGSYPGRLGTSLQPTEETKRHVLGNSRPAGSERDLLHHCDFSRIVPLHATAKNLGHSLRGGLLPNQYNRDEFGLISDQYRLRPRYPSPPPIGHLEAEYDKGHQNWGLGAVLDWNFVSYFLCPMSEASCVLRKEAV